MARPKLPEGLVASGLQMEQVSGNPVTGVTKGPSFATSLGTATSIFKRPGQGQGQQTDRQTIAKEWQIEAYRHVNICGEARYAATLFASLAGRAEIGVSEPQALARKAVWVTSGPEVDAFAEVAPTVRERSKLVRDFMLHRVIAGECYLIARDRVDTDPGYIPPPVGADGKVYDSWKDYLLVEAPVDLFDDEAEPEMDPNEAIWEIVAVTELRKIGQRWEVRHDNDNYLPLSPDDPVIRLWNPDPANRREAWSPFRSLLPTLREIEWLTAHIFKQVRSRLMSSGTWFLPNNLTFPPPPPSAVTGGAEAIAALNEAELFALSLAAAGSYELDAEDVEIPTIVLADPAALEQIDKGKLIQFWSEIDDKAMTMRSSAVRRFALGMDLPPEQVLGSSGLAVDGSGGSAGSVNHWGVWANEEQTISDHIEPALDDFVGVLTVAIIRSLFPDSIKVIGYDTASLRLKQDRSEMALKLYQEGAINSDVLLRETGFDPSSDKMGDKEYRRWVLTRLLGGSPTPEMMDAALKLVGVDLGIEVSGNGQGVPDRPGRSLPRNTSDLPYEGPPREQHDHSPAPFSAEMAAAEVLVLRALEKAGNKLLNAGKRGKDRDRHTPPHLAHLSNRPVHTVSPGEFDFSLIGTVLEGCSAAQIGHMEARMRAFCTDLYTEGEPYSREALMEALA